MMKIINYQLATEVNHGTPEEPVTETVLSDVTMPYTEANYAIAQSEAYQGKITVKDIPDPRPLSEIQSARQEENKAALAAWLAAHPLMWTDGNVYGVTEEDQNEMSLNLQQYQVQVAAGRSVNLEWHTQKKQCHTFTPEQYTALLLAIIDYVYPYRRYQEAVKAAIYAAETAEAVEAVVIDYAGVIVEEGDADA